MPYKDNSGLPKNVKSLPQEAQTMWRKIFNSAYAGTCKGRDDKDACAAKIAWSQVSKKYKKEKSNLTEFSLLINAATHNKKADTLRWKASASDVQDDLYEDNMTAELFSDFINRIDKNEAVPEFYQSDYWKGGMPYLSVSHYLDQGGKAVPGPIDKVYVDGNYLKATGEFDKTPLGLACYHAICEDLYAEKVENKNPIRISIGFLDWKHRHKDDGTVFDRENSDDYCPKCFLEEMTGKHSSKEYLRGQLVHLALTRVPVNERTKMEVKRSMTTRKEDAASIIGEELTDELEQENLGEPVADKQKALVEMSDTKDKEKEKVVEDVEIKSDVAEVEPDKIDVLSTKFDKFVESFSNTDAIHPLDEVLDEFKSNYDKIVKADLTAEEKLQSLQPSLDSIANITVKNIQDELVDPEVKESVVQADIITKALVEVMRPLMSKLDLVLDQTTQKANTEVPVRRSIQAIDELRGVIPTERVSAESKVTQSNTPKLRAMIEQSVGIQPGRIG